MNNELLSALKPIRYAVVAVLALLALFLLVKTLDLVAYGIGRSDTYATNTITVEGTGKGTAIPNLAVITFSVTENAATVAEAQSKATAKNDAALEAVSGLGIEEKDIKTLSYNVYPKYESQTCYSGVCTYGNPKIIGYEVTQTIEVKVRDTGKAGEALEALGALGVQNISGPNFTVDEDDAIRNVAREEAIKEAKAKAKALADELGVSLGKVVSFYENTAGYPAYGMGGYDGMMEKSAAPALPTGEQETSVSVSITYEIR